MKNLNTIKRIGTTLIVLINFVTLAKAQRPEDRIEEMKLVIPMSVMTNLYRNN